MHETYADRANLEVKPSPRPLSAGERRQRLANLVFGATFTEHMVTIPYADGAWGRGALGPYEPITLDPAASVLHYGQAVFEGFKAYRQGGGGIKTFRPDANARRFQRSAARLAMPEFPEERFVAAVDSLIALDKDWVPEGRGTSLYIRPFMISTEVALGVRPASRYLFVVIAAPVGAYFKGGLKPLSVWLSEDYIRAAPGGTGFAKCAGNYAASLIVQREATQNGCDQVVWLDAVNKQHVEEMGGMNMMFVFRRGDEIEIVTPPLTGTILPGITRESLLVLAEGLGYKTAERPITVDEWRAAAQSGEMVEAFACGTAAAVTPIGLVKSKAGSFTIGDGATGPVTEKLRDALLDIQYGDADDPHGWMHDVVP